MEARLMAITDLLRCVKINLERLRGSLTMMEWLVVDLGPFNG